MDYWRAKNVTLSAAKIAFASWLVGFPIAFVWTRKTKAQQKRTDHRPPLEDQDLHLLHCVRELVLSVCYSTFNNQCHDHRDHGVYVIMTCSCFIVSYVNVCLVNGAWFRPRPWVALLCAPTTYSVNVWVIKCFSYMEHINKGIGISLGSVVKFYF